MAATHAIVRNEAQSDEHVHAPSVSLLPRKVSDEVLPSVAAYRSGGGGPVSEPLVWPAMKRMLDRLYPGWRG